MKKQEKNRLDIRNYPINMRRSVRKQRAEKGVSDYDVLECKEYILDILYNILSEYVKMYGGAEITKEIKEKVLPPLYKARRDNEYFPNVYYPAIKKYIDEGKVSMLNFLDIGTGGLDDVVAYTLRKFFDIEEDNANRHNEAIKEAFTNLANVLMEM